MAHVQDSVAIIFTCGIFFALEVVTVCFANRWLIFTDEGWKTRRQVQWVMVTIVNILFLLSLASTAVSVYILMAQASFIEAGHRLEEFPDPSWDAIVKCTVADAIALLADIVLLHRIWVVYGRRMWVMWFPLFLYLGGIVCGVLQLFLQVKNVHNPDFGPYRWATVNMTVGPGIVLTPFWASTVALNAYCTSMIVWKIWKASEKGEDGSLTRQLKLLVRILMESGVLYLSVSLAHLLVWFGHSDYAIRMLGTVNTGVIPITFNLVLIRTAQNKPEERDIDNGRSKITTMNFGPRFVSSADEEGSIGTESTTHGILLQGEPAKGPTGSIKV